ncbi:hypothetical protein SporoS204_01635 [Sporosarcina ureae]|uniref:Cystathionine beta-lyase n=1 Tax=Sporosarcina ureae TaxID=1571 RepID=A0ABM6JS83_SPOUR|nr:hypothetical protein SporoS204_01635 [Sporosarcina ureae]
MNHSPTAKIAHTTFQVPGPKTILNSFGDLAPRLTIDSSLFSPRQRIIGDAEESIFSLVKKRGAIK